MIFYGRLRSITNNQKKTRQNHSKVYEAEKENRDL